MAIVYKKAYIEAAHLAGESSYMDGVAEKIRARAAGYAAEHKSNDGRPDTYSESFSVEKVDGGKGGFVKDRIVVTNDKNAKSKEFGHMTKGKNPQWVPGQLSLIRAANG